MLKEHILFASALTTLFTVCACGDIDEADRIVEGATDRYDVVPKEMTIDVDGESFTVTDQHHLLITDFTGWSCVNCPAMADYLTGKVTPNYASVLVSLHMTTNSFSANHRNGYNCASADSICNWINGGSAIATQLSLPSVTIDNVAWNGEVFNSDTTQIGNLVVDRYTHFLLSNEVPVMIGINVKSVDADTYNISTLVSKAPGQLNLKLWLIEEGLITTYQKSSKSPGFIMNYPNHGILRQVINGSYEGQDVTLDDEGQAVVHTRLNISGKGYVPSNCRVVAIVTAVGNTEVLNCTEAALAE